jgi:hypothetical protein
MRWERLFADLEARLDAEERAVAEGELSDLVRAERARLALRDRLRAHIGESLTWSLDIGEAGGGAEASLEGELLDVGADWVLVKAGRGEVLIPVSAVQFVAGLSRAALPAAGEVARRLRLGVVLRGLSRDRAVLDVRIRSGQLITGTIDRVGADHVDLAVHAGDVPRRSGAVRGLRCVLIPAIVSIAVQ